MIAWLHREGTGNASRQAGQYPPGCMHGTGAKARQQESRLQIEEMDEEEKQLAEALNIADEHCRRPKIKGFSVYT